MELLKVQIAWEFKTFYIYLDMKVGYHRHQNKCKNYKINPIKDLISVCTNCHAMLHKRKPAYSPEEIRNQILT
jgi:hypothetical protein